MGGQHSHGPSLIMRIFFLLPILALATLTAWLVGKQVFVAVGKKHPKWALATGILSGLVGFATTVVLVNFAFFQVVGFSR